MKTFFTYSYILFIQFLALFLVSCEDEEAPLPESTISSRVLSVTPMDGYVGDEIAIKGRAIDDCIIIKFEDDEIHPISINADEVHFIIPKNASSGDIIITFNDGRDILTQNMGFFKVLESAEEVLLQEVQNMKCFDFSSVQTGYYTAGNNVMKTSDGGENWVQVLNEVNSHPLYAVSDNEIWIDQNFGKPIKSNDGGNTWEKVDFDRENATVDYLALNQEMVFAIIYNNIDSRQELLYSKNDGRTWDELNHEVLQNKLADSRIVYQNGEDLILYNSKLNQLVSSRNLINWEVVAVEETLGNKTAESMYFIDKNSGWMLTKDGYFYTYNGGRTWDRRDIKLLNQYDQLLTIHFFNQYDGMIVTKDKGILKTSDGGISWQLRYLKGTDSVLEADFVDEDKSVIVSSIAEESGEAMLRKITY